jgi:hypothetical protein
VSPRGNDAAAAAEEFKAKMGASPNAEEMIELSAARWPRELRAANNRTVDEDATAELDDSEVEGLVGDRHVLGYAVRGPFVVVVSEDDTGFTTKEAFPHAGSEKEAARLSEPTPEDAEEADKAVQAAAAKEAKEAEKEAEKPAARK